MRQCLCARTRISDREREHKKARYMNELLRKLGYHSYYDYAIWYDYIIWRGFFLLRLFVSWILQIWAYFTVFRLQLLFRQTKEAMWWERKKHSEHMRQREIFQFTFKISWCAGEKQDGMYSSEKQNGFRVLTWRWPILSIRWHQRGAD